MIGAASIARANDLPEQVEGFVRSLADAVAGARLAARVELAGTAA